MLLAIFPLGADNVDTACLHEAGHITASINYIHSLSLLYSLLSHLEHSLRLKLVHLYGSALAHRLQSDWIWPPLPGFLQEGQCFEATLLVLTVQSLELIWLDGR